MGGWNEVNHLTDDQLAEKILTGCGGLGRFFPDYSVLRYLEGARSALDVGCGMGRNLAGVRRRLPGVTVTGYDSVVMLTRAAAYLARELGEEEAGGVELCPAWPVLAARRFDAAYATLAFQHFGERELRAMLRDLAGMTPRLLVCGRRWHDDGGNTWAIIRGEGWVLAPETPVPFEVEGPREGHDFGIFKRAE